MSAAASNANATAKKKGFLSGLMSGGGAGRTVFIAATATGIMAVLVSASILGNAADTGAYYVLNTDVAARTPITNDMLKQVITSAEGVPQSAYDPIYLSNNEVFAKYALRANDLVTASNTGPLESISKDLPAGFVVASLAAAPENACAGKIRRGDYIDVYAIDSAGSAAGANGGAEVSKMVLHHMLVLDVTVAPSTITQAAADSQAGANLDPGPESAAARGGIPALYTVAVTPRDAGKIALIRDKNVFLTLSSNNSDATPLSVYQKLTDLFGPGAVGDSGAGTAAAVKAAKNSAAAAAALAAGQPAPASPTLSSAVR